MKKILILILFFSVGLCLTGQNLYVQPISGEQVAFSLADKPKITFGTGTLIVQQTTFQLTDIQNLSFIPKGSTGIEMHLKDDKIFVFPNPVKDELSLVVQNPQGLSYRLFDMLGKQLMSDQIRSETTQINMQNFRAGVYVMHLLNNGQQIQSLKIIKQ